MAGCDPRTEFSPGSQHCDFERRGVRLVAFVKGFQQTKFARESFDVILKVRPWLDQREITAEADSIDRRAENPAPRVDPEILRIERRVAAAAFLERRLTFQTGRKKIRVQPQLVRFYAGRARAFPHLE